MTKAMDQLADVVTDTESDISLCSANETRSSFNLISQIFSNIAKFLLNEPTTDKIQLTNRVRPIPFHKHTYTLYSTVEPPY